MFEATWSMVSLLAARRMKTVAARPRSRAPTGSRVKPVRPQRAPPEDGANGGQFGEAIEQRIRAELFHFVLGISKSHDIDRRARAARGGHIRGSVTDHHRAAHVPPARVDRPREMFWVRLALRHRVCADDGGEPSAPAPMLPTVVARGRCACWCIRRAWRLHRPDAERLLDSGNIAGLRAMSAR